MDGGYAYPAINVHDIFSLNAVVQGFEQSGSDGIVQIYPDAALAVSGLAGDPAMGAITLADHAQRLADRCNAYIAIHSDHCSPEQLNGFLLPLIEESERRRAAGLRNLFTSHMFDGSAIRLEDNLKESRRLLERCAESGLWLELEVGVVGAEDDGTQLKPKVYTTTGDFLRIRECLGAAKEAGYLVAPAFGNVHGVYRPGEVVLRPEILEEGQKALIDGFGAPFPLVFHGGSGSRDDEIKAVVANGAVKMNIDTDGQYAFTGAIADYFFSNYRKVLRIDGEMGVKSAYFAETWLRHGGESLRNYVSAICTLLGSAGKTIGQR